MRAIRWGAILMCAACGAEPEPDTPACPEWFLDHDGDGFGGAGVVVVACEQPDGHVGNPYDCADGDPDIHPLAQERCDDDTVDEDCDGLADNHDPSALGRDVTAWPDADRDGHATGTSEQVCRLSEGWLSEPGRDCDDGDPRVYPDADDPLDGVDTNCDHLDGPALYDDFEAEGLDPDVWALSPGLVDTRTWVGEGQISAAFHGQGVLARTTSIDTSACDALAWHYLAAARNVFGDPRDLHVELWDGVDWRPLDTWTPRGDGQWRHRWGEVGDPSALHPELQIRFRAPETLAGTLTIDRLMVGCAFHGDADGVPDGIDCASADPLHRFDCGICDDDDLDGFGAGCDLGRDCDDADPAVHPAAADPTGDGLDDDCSGLDGPDFTDDFAGGPTATLWQPLVQAEVTVLDPFLPPECLHLFALGRAVTPPLDLSGCADGVWWEYLGWPIHPQGGELAWSVEGPDGWLPADVWASGSDAAAFERRWGVVSDPGAARAMARFRFDATSGWLVDDVHVACLVDVDGDDVHDPRDCAPDDPLHWFDCGACVDADGDGRGSGCDLGEDCDDGRAEVYPSRPDPSTDGVDQDCDGIDGAPVLFDDFEPDGLDAATWAFVNNHAIVHHSAPPQPADAFVKFFGGAGILEASPVDTSACPRIGWRILGRGVGAYVDGYELVVELESGGVWAEIDRWQVPPSPVDWVRHTGSFGGLLAQSPNLRIRLRGVSVSADRYVDVTELALGCAEP